MDGIAVRQLVNAPIDTVWDDLRQIERHVEWMHDAAKITFVSDQRSGVGTAFDCLTIVGPLRTVDRMEITSWVEDPDADRYEIGVRHVGLVTGEGVIGLERIGASHTVISWSERLDFPWYFAGPIGERFAAPVMGVIWRSSLRGFAKRFS